MRRNRRKQGDDDAEVDMTPMLDIVFIMLIFFIVTAVFLDDTAIDLTQPPPPPEDDNPNPDDMPAITVYVDERNSCSVEGEVKGCDGVLPQIESLLADRPGAAIILRLHEKASHRVLVSVKDGIDGAELKSKIEIVRGTT